MVRLALPALRRSVWRSLATSRMRLEVVTRRAGLRAGHVPFGPPDVEREPRGGASALWEVAIAAGPANVPTRVGVLSYIVLEFLCALPPCCACSGLGVTTGAVTRLALVASPCAVYLHFTSPRSTQPRDVRTCCQLC